MMLEGQAVPSPPSGHSPFAGIGTWCHHVNMYVVFTEVSITARD